MMETTSEQLLDFFCRTCMQELVDTSSHMPNPDPDKRWQSLLDPSGSICIAEMLCSAIPQINFELSDELPKKICLKCVAQLQSSYRFQEMCVQSQQRMLKMIGKFAPFKNFKLSAATEPLQSVNAVKVEGEFAPFDNLSEASQSSAATDPLQSANAVKVEADGASGIDVDNVEYIVNETQHSTVTVKDELVTVEEDKGQLSLIAPTHSCHLCKKSFKAVRLLQYHLKRHKKWDEQKDNPLEAKKKFEYIRYKCDLCSRGFYKAESLQKHRLAHNTQTGIPSYPCEVCNKRLSSRRTLWKHKKDLHSDKEKQINKRLSCEFCDKTFRFSATLKTHLRTHTGERPYLCPECGKAFSTSGQMLQHRFRHETVKRLECPHCPMKFSCISDLCKHKLSHDEIKKHICDICGASFVRSWVLKNHKMRHTGEKPYKCDYCDKRFLCSEPCRRHMRTHTGEKPYKCKYCDRAFAQTCDLNKHLRTHIGQNVYRCELCPAAFSSVSKRRLHFATHKNEDEPTRERNMKALKVAEAELKLNVLSTNNTHFVSGKAQADSEKE